jgi:acetoacetyl-CoA synthetase
MPLFVTLADGPRWTTARAAITDRLRSQYTARHVPDRIIQVPAIPVTLTGKKMEVPVRKILLGITPDEAANRNAMANPAALDAFAEYARTQQDYRIRSGPDVDGDSHRRLGAIGSRRAGRRRA